MIGAGVVQIRHELRRPICRAHPRTHDLTHTQESKDQEIIFFKVPYTKVMIIKKQFDESEEIVVSKKELRSFVLNCLEKVSCSPGHAQQLADILICSDYRGHYSHGLNRLHIYVNDLAEKSTLSDGEPIVIKQKGATAWVDGCNLLGPVVGNFCMKLAIQKARTHGIGWVVAKNSNHFGIAGWYAESALQQGLVGMAFTNTSPCVFPTNSAEKSLGSNPICLAAPAANGDSFFLDMASTTVAYGKIEVVDRRGGKRIPRAWGADADGIETQDPKEVLNGGGLQPLGGSEATGGYKGTGLCMMVEILCGIMAGSSFGKSIRKWQTTDESANLGQCFVAIDPECFAPGFGERLSCFLDETRDLKPVDPSYPVQVAGDPERAHMYMCDELDGIVYKKSQLEHLNKLANDLGVHMFKAKKMTSSLETDGQSRIELEV
uniref:Malate L-lactate dehydrogenase domain containing protein n=3 Tax=Haemonchus contortus TaxID=6289 RepID=W6NF54_HAECO